MIQRLLFATAAIAVAAAFSPAAAMDIAKHARDSDTLTAIALSGEIKTGDLFQLQAYITKLPRKQRIAVFLDSPGGNLGEGIKFGRFFYRAKIQTVIESKGRCFSACALAFLGGRDARTGKPSRTKTSTGALAYHSFSLNLDKNKSYTAADMAEAVQVTQELVLEIADYLREIGTDLDFLRIMFRAHSDQANFISNDEAITVGIRVWDEDKKQIVNPDAVLDRFRLVPQ